MDCGKAWAVNMMKMMKKKTGILSAFLAAVLLAGCGEKTDASLNEMKVEKYVTLGDYMNFDISARSAVDEEECDQLLLAVYQSNVTSENGGIHDRAVENGDIVNIDYVGTKDGTAFGGGTASGVDLEIGSDSYIPGFESGLIGAMPGETRELNLNFPENYQNSAELAGQAVVFTVRVNFIQPREMEDSVAAAFGIDNVASVQELRRYVYDYLDRVAEQQYIYQVQNDIIEQLTDRSTIGELPESFLESYRQMYRDRIADIAASMNITPDLYTNYSYQMNSEDFAFLYGELQARQDILLQAIANKEGWTVGDDEMDELIGEFALENGYQSAEELEAELSREQLRNLFMSERVMEHLVENAVGNSKIQ